MRFDQAHALKMHSRRAYEPIEYPKYLKVDGKDVLALSAEHEVELIGVPEAAEEDESPAAASNLLSAPEKRKPGRPRIIRPDEE